MTNHPFDLRSFWPPAAHKKKLACVTMARNEEFFLEMMVRHYLAADDDVDFYIIDHASTVPVQDFLKATFPELRSGRINVIRIPDIPFDDDYKAVSLSNLGSMVTRSHEVVIVSDADELVFTEGGNLVQTCLSHASDIIAPLGFEVVQNTSIEGCYDLSLSAFEQRTCGFFKSSQTKPVVWKAPTMASAGLHKALHPFEITSEILTLHMRLADVDEATKRIEERKTSVFSENQTKRNYGTYWAAPTDVRLRIFDTLQNKELSPFVTTRDKFFNEVRSSVHKNPLGFYQPNLHIVSEMCVR
ncbi:hypothetical protein [uncultured Paracoccus sp.]|jgi:hypothetical protein|uniref:hypothetical protein n=1 Tax=uncultured Paracoccus sp. TaxID=189685 RepID=UPI0030DA7A26|tara:strand:+ start:429 stop:1328 length:900 start_codon:yes stop_codon:yes gene_type:complete